MIFSSIFLFCFLLKDTSAVKKSKLKDCIRPWQSPIFSVPTISSPARPLQCDPDERTCPEGKNSHCQFSLRTFKYICCQDKAEVEPPICPKFHDTLLMTCGANMENSCPRDYKCMPSRYDETTNICCKPNDGLTYPEPETTFRENKIVPQVMAKAPKTEAELKFGNISMRIGQLFDLTQLAQLEEIPTIKTQNLTDESQYTVILIDSTTSHVNWLVGNVDCTNGNLDFGTRNKATIQYVKPTENDKPEGMHILVLAIFEQTEAWTLRELSKVAVEDFNFRRFVEAPAIPEQPAAGTFFAYSTVEDERY